MISDETATPPAPPLPSAPSAPAAITAPPRAVRLADKPVASPEELLLAAKRYKAESSVSVPLNASSLEKKLAGLHDAQEMLHVMNTELALQRAVRLHGGDGKSRQAMRVLSITALFALLIAALAAMSWMQGHLAQKGFGRHQTESREQR